MRLSRHLSMYDAHTDDWPTHKEHIVAIHDQFEAAAHLTPLDHRYPHLPPPLSLHPVLLLLRLVFTLSRSVLRGAIKVRDPFFVAVVVELHDEEVEERGEEDEEDEGVREGGAVAGIVVSRPAPGGYAVFVEKLSKVK